VGDFDSVREEVLDFYRDKGTTIVRKECQDSTDLQKSFGVLAHLEKESSIYHDTINVVGALGGNFTQELSNVNILYEYPRKIYLISAQNVTFLLDKGKNVIQVAENEARWQQIRKEFGKIYCGLLPIGESCKYIKTSGLCWNLDGESLEFGRMVSTSNEMTDLKAEVEASNRVLWTFDFRGGKWWPRT